MPKLTRRRFVVGALGGIGAAGGLVIGWFLTPPRQRLMPRTPLRAAAGEVALNGWVKISADDTITVMMSQSEMGQGAHTGLAMLLADELDADWTRIRLEQSSFDAIYNNQASVIDSLPFRPDDHGTARWVVERFVENALRTIPGLTGTGGSSSIKDQFLPLRQAGASARAMLVAAAANAWGVPVAQCAAHGSRVSHPSGREATYGELAARAGSLPVPVRVTLKRPDQFVLLGRDVPRLDSAGKVDGSAKFAIDCLPAGGLYASVRLCPTLGGRVARLDASAALARGGVRAVVELPPVAGGVGGVGHTSGGVAVVASTRFEAIEALRSVVVEWDHGSAGGVSSIALDRALSGALDSAEGRVHFEVGDVEAAFRDAATTVSAEYRVPLLAHAAMEPLNCTVQFKDGAATVWAGTQSPGFARRAVAEVLGIPTAKVEVRVPYLGGGFGRRFLTDVIVQTAVVARQCGGLPVQLLWSREDDTTHDFYRPAFASRAAAAFDRAGRLTGWRITSCGSSLGAPAIVDAATDGASNTPYEFPSARVAHQRLEPPVTLGIWRSVNHSQNAFFTECFIDECAAAVGRDPVVFRSELLRSHPRHLAVLQTAAEAGAWNAAPPTAPDGARTARGIALHESFGSIVAQVAEVSVDATRRIRVHRVVCVVDCGFAVNPNLIRQQVEGSIVFALAATLDGEITIENGQVMQRNFNDALALRLDACPLIESVILPSDAAPGGVGECAVPPLGPAVANAVHALTGQRIRRLPLRLG